MHKSKFPIELEEVAGLWNRGSVVRSWLCELAERAFERGGQRPRATSRATSTDSGEGRWTIVDAIDHDVPTPVITAALYARFYSRGEGDYTHRVLAALRNQFGGHAVERADRDGRCDAMRRAPREQVGENPLVEGLERLPVPPTTLVIFGATGDLAAPQAAAGALQPRPRGRAARALQPDRRRRAASRPTTTSATVARESIAQFSRREPDEQVLDGLLERMRYVRFSFDDAEGYGKLGEAHRGARRGGRAAAQPRLLPVDRAGVLPGHRRAAQGGRASTATSEVDVRVDHREAVRHRPRVGARAAARSSRASSASARSSASTTTWARRPSRT